MTYTSEDQVNGETRMRLEKTDLEARLLASTNPTYETLLNYYKTSKALKDYASGVGAAPVRVMEISLCDWPMSEKELYEEST